MDSDETLIQKQLSVAVFWSFKTPTIMERCGFKLTTDDSIRYTKVGLLRCVFKQELPYELY